MTLAGVLESIKVSQTHYWTPTARLRVEWTNTEGDSSTSELHLAYESLTLEKGTLIWMVSLSEPMMTGEDTDFGWNTYPPLAYIYFRKGPLWTPKMALEEIKPYLLVLSAAGPDYGKRTGPEDTRLLSERYWPTQGKGVFPLTWSTSESF